MICHDAERGRHSRVNSWFDLVEDGAVVADEVDLVDREHELPDAHQVAIVAWRRVCSSRPARASTSSTARSAVEAPVAMLRVYCSWPGVSATMKARLVGREIAIGDVDGDALFALGLAGRRAAARNRAGRDRSACRALRDAAPRAWSSSTALVSQSRRPISVDLPSSTLPQVMRRSGRPTSRAARRARRRASTSGVEPQDVGCRGSSSEISFALLLFHRAGLVAVDGAALAFGDGGGFESRR